MAYVGSAVKCEGFSNIPTRAHVRVRVRALSTYFSRILLGEIAKCRRVSRLLKFVITRNSGIQAEPQHYPLIFCNYNVSASPVGLCIGAP